MDGKRNRALRLISDHTAKRSSPGRRRSKVRDQGERGSSAAAFVTVLPNSGECYAPRFICMDRDNHRKIVLWRRAPVGQAGAQHLRLGAWQFTHSAQVSAASGATGSRREVSGSGRPLKRISRLNPGVRENRASSGGQSSAYRRYRSQCAAGCARSSAG